MNHPIKTVAALHGVVTIFDQKNLKCAYIYIVGDQPLLVLQYKNMAQIDLQLIIRFTEDLADF